MPTPPDPVVRFTRNAAVASLLALIVLGLAWELWLAPTGHRTLALKVLPLAVPLAGLLKYRMHTYRWLSLFVWVYFAEGVVRAVGDRGVAAEAYFGIGRGGHEGPWRVARAAPQGPIS